MKITRFCSIAAGISMIISPFTALAGNLDNAAVPAAGSGMPTTTEIYNRLDIGAAITPAGTFREPSAGPIGEATAGKTLADIQGKLPVTDDAGAVASEVLSGKKFWGLTNAAWGPATGTAVAGDNVTGTNGSLSVSIPTGFYSGGKTATATDSNLVNGNIKAGATIFGVSGSSTVVDTSTGTAAAGDILSGKTAFVNGAAVTGSAVAGSNVTGTNGSLTIAIPDGLYSGGKTATATDTNLVASNIKSGVSILGIAGTFAPALAKRVNKTGQTTSYATGDDGYYQYGISPAITPSFTVSQVFNTPSYTGTRFIDNGNGTVTDTLTALVWLKNASCLGNGTFAQGLSAANNLSSPNSACGLSDGSTAGQWRIPNLNEMHSLGPVWPPEGFISLDTYTAYMTSTSYSSDMYYDVFFSNGGVGNWSKSSAVHLWAVRGGQ